MQNLGDTIANLTEGQTLTPAVTTPETEKLPAKQAGPDKMGFYWGTGRRKTAVARVRLKPGSGKFEVNGKAANDYFSFDKDRLRILQPLQATDTFSKVDIYANTHGGGPTGQADAIVLGVARALKLMDGGHLPALRDGLFLRRDSRQVERKKYGRSGARRRFQFSKR